MVLYMMAVGKMASKMEKEISLSTIYLYIIIIVN